MKFYGMQIDDTGTVLIYSGDSSVGKTLHGVFNQQGISPLQIRELRLSVSSGTDPDPVEVQIDLGESALAAMRVKRRVRLERQAERTWRAGEVLDALAPFDPDTEGKAVFAARLHVAHAELRSLGVMGAVNLLAERVGKSPQTVRMLLRNYPPAAREDV